MMRNLLTRPLLLLALALAGCRVEPDSRIPVLGDTTSASPAVAADALGADADAAADEHEADADDTEVMDKDVPYVPTDQNTVDEMLRMARVSRSDVLYDLGSGDGRIVITAAKQYGARGVGIDIDPVRVSEANFNADNAGVADRVRFIEGDLFDANLREATVVTLYLLPEVNLRLRPKLFAELRPGTPVISHDFNMGDWSPDESLDLGSDVLFKWVIPADVRGTWRWTTPRGLEMTATIDQKYQVFIGRATTLEGTVTLMDPRLSGAEISFAIPRTDATRRMVVDRYSGRAAGNRIEGELVADGARTRWVADRD